MAKKFFIRTSASKGTATLYVQISKRTPKVRFLVCTGIDVDIATWNRANRTPKTWLEYIATEDGSKLYKQMLLVENSINKLISDGKVRSNADKPIIDEAVRAIIYKDVTDFNAELEEKKRREREELKRCIINFYDYFLEGIQDGTIRHGNDKPYTKGSIEIWVDFGNYLKEYCPLRMTFNEINKPFADKFSVYLEQKGLMKTTVNKNIICFRKLCNLAAEEGINSNAVSLKVWKERTIHSNDKKTEIYLTDEELNGMYAMQLTGKKEQVRDVFRLSCLVCQRFSDFSLISRRNFRVLDDGTIIIDMRQKKTGNVVNIPVLDDRILAISRKYNYELPKLSQQQVNRYLKLIAKELAKTVPSLAEKDITLLSACEARSERLYQSLCERKAKDPKMKTFTADEKNEWYKLHVYATEHNGSPLFERDADGNVIRPKYEMITSHTARRSGITNLYKSGLLNNHEMMSISGHQTERVFERYIKTGKEEEAMRIAAKFKANSGNMDNIKLA